jgi:hypothetical protein
MRDRLLRIGFTPKVKITKPDAIRPVCLWVLNRKRLAGGGLGKLGNGRWEVQDGEVHALDASLTDAQPVGFPEMPHRLRSEPQQPRAHHVGWQRVGTGDDDPGLDHVAANRSNPDHSWMANGDGELDGEPPGHGGNERMQVVEEIVLVGLTGADGRSSRLPERTSRCS